MSLHSSLHRPLRVVIIDDEKAARELLKGLLQQSPVAVEVAGDASGVAEGIALLEKVNPDLVLLDVNLSPGSGFDILSRWQGADFDVIFITAHDEHAVRAIRSSALDYIVKPVPAEELYRALERCAALRQESPSGRMEIFKENLVARGGTYNRIVLPTQKGFTVLGVQQILYCEADRAYTHFHLEQTKQLTSSRPLRHYDDLLSPQGFFRSHPSWLINLEFVRGYERRKKGGVILMEDKREVPLSETAKKDFQQLFPG